MSSLLNWCGLVASNDASTRGDPHLITFNGIKYDFQSAGEFVLLRHYDGMEVQTRQTLSPQRVDHRAESAYRTHSCVGASIPRSPRGSASSASRTSRIRMESRIARDFSCVSTASRRSSTRRDLNLGGGGRIVKSAVGDGIEILFPNKTHLIVTSNFWGPPNNQWYLNIDVVNTPAREGVMGAICPAIGCPRYPTARRWGRYRGRCIGVTSI